MKTFQPSSCSATRTQRPNNFVLLLVSLLGLLASCFDAQAQSRVIVGYFQNWNNASAPYVRLREVDARYNVVDIAFATPVSASDMTMGFVPTQQSKAEFIADMRVLQGQGRKVLISVGGADAPVELNTTADKDKFVSSMKALIADYGFDGFDIDLEGNSVILNSGDTNFKSSTTPKIVNLIAAARDITTYFRGQGKDFWLTSAPETQYVQGGYGNYGTAFGGYLPVLYGVRDLLTFVHVQYYNTGSQNALDGRVYGQSTPDFIVAMTDMLLRGFPVAGNTANVFPALRQDQVAFGLPATGTGAAPAGGYVTPADVTKALNYLVKGISYGGTYVLSATYPNLRGIMTWSVNWDLSQGNPFVTNANNFFSTLGTPNTPPTVSLTAPAANATYAAPASITLTANAADANGTVAKVDFYQGTTLLGTDTSSPYSYTWTGVGAGSYSLTAKATDNAGAATTSAAVSVTVTGSGPTPQAIPGTIQAESFTAQSGTQTETTTDTGGGLNVDYFETNDWLDYSVSAVTAGNYTVGFRVASANGGATLQLRTSGGTVLGSVNVGNTGGWQAWQTINATVTLPAGVQTLRLFASASTGCNVNYLTFTKVTPPANTPPTVSLTSPAGGASFTAPASITLSANAADADGTISSVAFYNGTTLLNTDTSSPYSYVWTGVAAGSYSLTAKATDNSGAVTTSAAVAVTVTAGGSGCSVAAWTATAIYTASMQASRGGNLYTAKWWTQNEDPLTASCQYCVWQLVGPCASARLASSNVVYAPQQLDVYPNPAQGKLLTVDLDRQYKYITINIIYGSSMTEQTASYHQVKRVQLPVSDLPKGLLLLRINADGNVFTKRIMNN